MAVWANFIIFVAVFIYEKSFMESGVKKITELDIVEAIQSKGGNDFLIDFDIISPIAESNGELLIRNGIVMMLCNGDGGRIVIDNKEYVLSRNNVVILPENHIVSHLTPEMVGRQSVIAVSVDYILNMPSPIDTNIFGYSRYISVIKVSDEKYEDLMSYYRFIYKESKEEGRYQNEIIRSIFYALILEVIAEYERVFSVDAARNIKADNLSDRFFRQLATNYKTNRSVKFYADRLNLTPKYLSTAIKRATGRPILDWIHEAILIDAKMLLRTTDMTVQEIADQLNFSSSSAFVQFIKSHTGSTPRKLR